MAGMKNVITGHRLIMEFYKNVLLIKSILGSMAATFFLPKL